MPLVDKIGGLFTLNTTTTGLQYFPAVAALNNGGFVAAWTDFNSASPDDPDLDCVRARIFDANGNPAGAEFRVNSSTALGQSIPDIAVLSDGSFIITFQHEFSPTDFNLLAQRYAENGTPIGGEFAIASTTARDEFQGQVTAGYNGQYLVVWGQDDNIVSFKQINNDGIQVSGPIDPPPNADQLQPSVTTLVDGTYVAAWVENGEIYERGMAGGAPGQLANTTTLNPQRSVNIQALEDGGYVVVWVDDGAGLGAEPFVLGQRFSSFGNKVGGEFAVNNVAGSIDSTAPRIAALGNGGFMVLWDDRNLGLQAQCFDRFNNKFGGVVSVAPVTGIGGSFGAADLTVRENGDVVVVFGGLDGASNVGIQGQIIRPFNEVNGDNFGNFISGAQSILNPGFDFSDVLNGFDGNDTLSARGGAQDFLNGGDGTDTSTYIYAAERVVARLDNSLLNQGDAAGDVYSSIENLDGSDFDDDLVGEGGINLLRGGLGADRLFGVAGDDRLIGGEGADYLSGGLDKDTASYEDSSNGLTASLINPLLNSGIAAGDTYNSIEHLVGTDSVFGDALYGNNGANDLSGRAGNDALTGLGGIDRLFGGTENDTLNGGAGGDYLSGGTGSDTASYAGAPAGVIVSLANPAINTGDALGDTFNSVENLTGSDFADSLNGNNGVNVLRGGNGDDTLKGYLGTDTLYGDAGNDTLIGGTGQDTLDGSADTDTASYAGAAAGVTASLSNPALNTNDAFGDTYVSIENLTGTSFADFLLGNNNANVMTGGNGDDIFKAYGGSDTVFGGGGDDKIIFNTALNAATNVDILSDFSVADDTIQLDNAIFAALGAGPNLAAGAFFTGAAATLASHRIIYNAGTGTLSYDADGVGGVASIRFATVFAALTSADFQVI